MIAFSSNLTEERVQTLILDPSNLTSTCELLLFATSSFLGPGSFFAAAGPLLGSLPFLEEARASPGRPEANLSRFLFNVPQSLLS